MRIAEECQTSPPPDAGSALLVATKARQTAGWQRLAARNVRINCVSPGYMRTPMSTGERLGATPEEQEASMERFARLAPMGRPGSTLDIADAIVYLASDESRYVTGQEIVVDGGYLVR